MILFLIHIIPPRETFIACDVYGIRSAVIKYHEISIVVFNSGPSYEIANMDEM